MFIRVVRYKGYFRIGYSQSNILTPPGPAYASLCVVLGPQPPGGLTYGGRGYSGSYARSPGEEGNIATDAAGERDEKDLFQ